MRDFFMFSHSDIQAILLTLKVAVVSSVIIMPMAVWISYKLSRKHFHGKLLVEGLLHFPLVAPPVVTGYLLLLFLGRQGFLGEPLFHLFGISVSFSFAAAVIASLVVSLPLAVRTMKSTFELIDPAYETAARSLGLSKWKTFYRVTVPMALPGIISGFVIAFARSLGEFGATITFAGNIEGETQTIALAVFTQMQIPGNEWSTFRLVLISVIISILAIAASEYFRKKTQYLH